MTPKLTKAISELYETFKNYNSGPTIIGSPMYKDNIDEWNKNLFSKKLTELTEDDLSRFTGKVISTWGDTTDFKHFLPRIFELTAAFKTPYEIWIAFDKLTLAEWKTWEEKEQKVIQEYMLALWESLLHDESATAEAEFKNYFSSIAHFYPNFTDLLTIWSNSKSKAAVKHLSTILINEQIALFDRNKISGFYDKTENASELINWILSDRTLKLLQDSYFEFENENFSERISWAEKIIETKRKNK